MKLGGSPNVKVLGHIPLGGFFRVMDNEIEQEPNRPYTYVAQSRDRQGFTIIRPRTTSSRRSIAG